MAVYQTEELGFVSLMQLKLKLFAKMFDEPFVIKGNL